MIIIGTPHKHNAGYYKNDDRASGGLKTEADIQSCVHCQAVILMQKWKEDGGWCGRCSKPICGPCADRMLTKGCEPFIQKIEQALESNFRRQQFRKIAGI